MSDRKLKLGTKIGILLWTVVVLWFAYWVADGMPDYRIDGRIEQCRP